MREITFRGKWIDNGEWVEGYYAKQSNHACFAHELKYQHFIFKDVRLDFNLGGLQEFEVYPETVGQYTGLTDKNGRKIFEGDVLKIDRIGNGLGDCYIPPLPYPVNVAVKWDLCGWMCETLCDDKRYIQFPDAWCCFRCEVIGNIHDNSDCGTKMDSDEE